MRNAGRIGSYLDTVLYSTLMPCYLCGGAVVQFGIKKVIIGESRAFEGSEEFMKQRGVEVINLDNNECIKSLLNPHHVLHYENYLISQRITLYRVLKKLSIFLILTYFHSKVQGL